MRSFKINICFVLMESLGVWGIGQAAHQHKVRQFGPYGYAAPSGYVAVPSSSTPVTVTLLAEPEETQIATVQAKVTHTQEITQQLFQTMTQVSTQQITIVTTMQNYVTIPQTQTITETVSGICSTTTPFALAQALSSTVSTASAQSTPSAVLTPVVELVSAGSTGAVTSSPVSVQSLPTSIVADASADVRSCDCQCLCPAEAFYNAFQIANNNTTSTLQIPQLSTFQTVVSPAAVSPTVSSSSSRKTSITLSTSSGEINAAAVMSKPSMTADITSASSTFITTSNSTPSTTAAKSSIGVINAQAISMSSSAQTTSSAASSSAAPFDINTYQLHTAITIRLGS